MYWASKGVCRVRTAGGRVRKFNRVPVGALGALVLLLAVTVTAGNVQASNGASFEFFVGFEPDPGVAMANNGDTIALLGIGTFNTISKVATGGGTFVHKNSAGDVLAAGTWTAVKLVSFKSYGNQPDVFPPDFEGGRARISVLLDPGGDGIGPMIPAALMVLCAIGNVPDNKGDENLLNVLDVINFNKAVSGFNLFIRL